MATNRPRILSVAAALAAVTASAPAAVATTEPHLQPTGDPHDPAQSAQKAPPNEFVRMGDDLLGFTVDRGSDGRIITADHYSHYSHASHSSHSSHASHYSGA